MPALTEEASKSCAEDQDSQDSEARDPPLYLSGSFTAQQNPLDASNTFGYGEDEFEVLLVRILCHLRCKVNSVLLPPSASVGDGEIKTRGRNSREGRSPRGIFSDLYYWIRES